MRGVKYYYDSRSVDADQRTLIERLEEESVEVVDTANWSTEELTDVYYAELVPRGSGSRTDLGQALRDASGPVSFATGVLVTPDGCFVGEDIERAFDSLFPDLYVDLYDDSPDR